MARGLVHGISAVLAAALGACASAASPPAPAAPTPAPPTPAAPTPAPQAESRALNPLQALIETAAAVRSTLDCALLLSAPRVAHSRPSMPTRVELLAVLDEYLRVLHEHGELIDDSEGPVAKTVEPHARRLRELVQAWTPTQEVPIDIQLAARAMLDAMGMSPPPGGWDAFEGFHLNDGDE